MNLRGGGCSSAAGTYAPAKPGWSGRREPDVANPGSKVGAAETLEDGRDHRAGHAQASAAGVMLLP
jgi:hypothetical protein